MKRWKLKIDINSIISHIPNIDAFLQKTTQEM